MPINTKKNLAHCLAKSHITFWPNFEVPTCNSRMESRVRRSARFFAVYLWDSEGELTRQIGLNCGGASVPEQCNWRWSGPGRPGHLSELLWALAKALRLPKEWVWWRRWMPPRVGELHFVQGQWDEELVAHEVFHATVHVLRSIGPRLEHVIGQRQGVGYVFGLAEEDAAYLHGAMVRDVYRWLWEVDPSKKWLRAPGASENIQ